MIFWGGVVFGLAVAAVIEAWVLYRYPSPPRVRHADRRLMIARRSLRRITTCPTIEEARRVANDALRETNR